MTARREHGLLRPLGAIALVACCLVEPSTGFAASPSAKSQPFDAPYRKTVEDYERDGGAAGRGAFERGLEALDANDLNKAQSEFDASAAASPSYEAAFNAALSMQLAHRYDAAATAYEKARSPERRDPELETNLALALAAESKRDASLKSVEAGLAMTEDPDVKGRILYQRSQIQFKFGQPLDAFDSLAQADTAFQTAGDAHGRAIVAARRGVFLIAIGGDGRPPLREGADGLQRTGALVDESQARRTLAAYELEAGDAQAAEQQFNRAHAAAEASGNAHQLGQSLDDFSLSHLRQGQNDAAIKDYEAAIAAFQKAHDRVGEGEAVEDLARLYLATGDFNRGFEYAAKSVRAYRKAGLGQARAGPAATEFADLFQQSGEEERQKYFLDIAQWLLGASPPRAAKANLLVGLARYNINHDLEAAEANAKEAHEIYLSRQDAGNATIAELVLERIHDARNRNLQDLFIGASVFSFLLLMAIWLWAELWAAAKGAARLVLAPPRWAATGIRRLDAWWTGQPTTEVDEETRRFTRFRIRLLALLFAAMIVLAIAVDAVTVVGPNLGYISKLGQTVTTEGEILPPDLIGAIRGLLDRASNFVLLAVLVQVVILAVGYVVALLASGVIESAVFGSITRFLRPAGPPIDTAVRAPAMAALRNLQSQAAMLWVTTTIAALAIVVFGQAPLRFVGLGLLAVLLVSEAVLYLSMSRALAALPADRRLIAFDFVARTGFHHVCTVMAGILAGVYFLIPAFYGLANFAQRRLVLPPFAAVENGFFSTLYAAVPKYGTFMLTGDVAVGFSELRKSYEPDAGAAQLWWDALPRLLLYTVGAWAILLASRVALPMVASLGGWRLAAKILRLAIFAVLFHQATEFFFRYAFQLDEAELLNSVIILLITAVLTIIVEYFVGAALGAHEGAPHPTHGDEMGPAETPPHNERADAQRLDGPDAAQPPQGRG